MFVALYFLKYVAIILGIVFLGAFIYGIYLGYSSDDDEKRR